MHRKPGLNAVSCNKSAPNSRANSKSILSKTSELQLPRLEIQPFS